MFDQIDFEQKFYKLIVDEVNAAHSQLMNDCKGSLQIDLIKEGLKIQRQVMESLHAITEEAAMQGFYRLLAGKEANK